MSFYQQSFTPPISRNTPFPESPTSRQFYVERISACSLCQPRASDDRTRLAVERSFEIIGEALNRSFKIAPQQIDSIRNYRQIISFRNILAHCYDSVEDKLVWGIIEGSLPEQITDFQSLLGH